MPRAYSAMTLWSKPGKRRWYLAMSCGSNRPCRSRGMNSSSLPLSLGVEHPLGQRLLQLIEQAFGFEQRLRVTPGQQLIDQFRFDRVGLGSHTLLPPSKVTYSSQTQKSLHSPDYVRTFKLPS